MAARKVVSPSTLIGPFELERALRLRVVLSANFSFFTSLSLSNEIVIYTIF